MAEGLPKFKDQILHSEGTGITYWVKVYYNGFQNDKEEYDVSHLSN